MRALQVTLRVLGWLLTPFVAWAASFFGAWVGALLAPLLPRPVPGLVLTVGAGGATGFTLLVLWIRLLRRSPELRQALHVMEDGTPDTRELAAELHLGAGPEEDPAEEEARAGTAPAS